MRRAVESASQHNTCDRTLRASFAPPRLSTWYTSSCSRLHVRPSVAFIRSLVRSSRSGVNLGATTNTVGTWNICRHLPRNACCARYKFRYNGNTVLSGLYARREFSAQSRISFRETGEGEWQKGGRIFVHAINLRYISVRKNHYTAEEIIGPYKMNKDRESEKLEIY